MDPNQQPQQFQQAMLQQPGYSGAPHSSALYDQSASVMLNAAAMYPQQQNALYNEAVLAQMFYQQPPVWPSFPTHPQQPSTSTAHQSQHSIQPHQHHQQHRPHDNNLLQSSLDIPHNFNLLDEITGDPQTILDDAFLGQTLFHSALEFGAEAAPGLNSTSSTSIPSTSAASSTAAQHQQQRQHNEFHEVESEISKHLRLLEQQQQQKQQQQQQQQQQQVHAAPSEPPAAPPSPIRFSPLPDADEQTAVSGHAIDPDQPSTSKDFLFTSPIVPLQPHPSSKSPRTGMGGLHVFIPAPSASQKETKKTKPAQATVEPAKGRMPRRIPIYAQPRNASTSLLSAPARTPLLLYAKGEDKSADDYSFTDDEVLSPQDESTERKVQEGVRRNINSIKIALELTKGPGTSGQSSVPTQSTPPKKRFTASAITAEEGTSEAAVEEVVNALHLVAHSSNRSGESPQLDATSHIQAGTPEKYTEVQAFCRSEIIADDEEEAGFSTRSKVLHNRLPANYAIDEEAPSSPEDVKPVAQLVSPLKIIIRMPTAMEQEEVKPGGKRLKKRHKKHKRNKKRKRIRRHKDDGPIDDGICTTRTLTPSDDDSGGERDDPSDPPWKPADPRSATKVPRPARPLRRARAQSPAILEHTQVMPSTPLLPRAPSARGPPFDPHHTGPSPSHSDTSTSTSQHQTSASDNHPARKGRVVTTTTQNMWLKGSFIVEKSDVMVYYRDTLSNDPPAIWRVDNQNLLQKFIARRPESVDDDALIFVSTPTFSGWCQEYVGKYAPLIVRYLEHSRNSSTVALECSLTDLLPPPASLPLNNEQTAANEQQHQQENWGGLSPPECDQHGAGPRWTPQPDHPLLTALDKYLNSLILRALPASATSSSVDASMSRYIAEVESLNFEKKAKILNSINWSDDFRDALEWYPFVTVSSAQEPSALPCQGCEVSTVDASVQVYGEPYVMESLQPRQHRVTATGSPCPSVEYHVCTYCSEVASSYHKLYHMKFNLFRAVQDKVDLIVEEAGSGVEPAVVTEQCLRNRTWVKQVSQDYLDVWQSIS